MINIEEKQKEIEATNFWDAWVYDTQILYFGDEITIICEDEGSKCWKLTFVLVGKVDYNNYGFWSSYRGNEPVKEKSEVKYHYYMQEVLLKPHEKDFIECFVDLGQMELTIICRDIKVEHCNLSDFHFFWQDNEKKED